MYHFKVELHHGYNVRPLSYNFSTGISSLSCYSFNTLKVKRTWNSLLENTNFLKYCFIVEEELFVIVHHLWSYAAASAPTLGLALSVLLKFWGEVAFGRASYQFAHNHNHNHPSSLLHRFSSHHLFNQSATSHHLRNGRSSPRDPRHPPRFPKRWNAVHQQVPEAWVQMNWSCAAQETNCEVSWPQGIHQDLPGCWCRFPGHGCCGLCCQAEYDFSCGVLNDIC